MRFILFIFLVTLILIHFTCFDHFDGLLSIQKERSVIYMAASILTLMLLPLFYVIVFLHQRYLIDLI